jgi:hypothetical protein
MPASKSRQQILQIREKAGKLRLNKDLDRVSWILDNLGLQGYSDNYL